MILSESRSVVARKTSSGDGMKSRTAVKCQLFNNLESRQTDSMPRYAFAFPVPERQIDGVCGGNDLDVCFGAPRWTPGNLVFNALSPSIGEDHGTSQVLIGTGMAHATLMSAVMRRRSLVMKLVLVQTAKLYATGARCQGGNAWPWDYRRDAHCLFRASMVTRSGWQQLPKRTFPALQPPSPPARTQLLCLTNTKTWSNLLVHRMLLILLPFAKDLRTANGSKSFHYHIRGDDRSRVHDVTARQDQHPSSP
jgi:hypothetical protein